MSICSRCGKDEKLNYVDEIGYCKRCYEYVRHRWGKAPPWDYEEVVMVT